jgi:hypothetical protein
MDWPAIEEIESAVRMPRGYRLELLNPHDVTHFIKSLTDWYPDIQAGCESRFLRTNFYKTTLLPDDQQPRQRFFLPIIFRHESSGELAGCIFLEKNESALTITAPLGVIATNHRHTGSGISSLPSLLIAEVGRMMGLELAYYVSTLKSPANQIIAERTGYKLVGIIPGNDRDMVSPGVTKRVFEAIYAKLLVPENSLYVPTADCLTNNTRNLWSKLFPSIPLR